MPVATGLRGVLIVDDCPDTLASLEMLLRIWGHQTWTACDAEDALRLAEAHRPAVAMIDVALGGTTGWELTRRLRLLPGLGRMYVMAVTGYGRPADVERSREAGCDVHLTKPVNPALLHIHLAEHHPPAAAPLPPERLAALLGDLRAVADLIEAIDDPTRRRGSAGALSGWRDELGQWGVRFRNGDGAEVVLSITPTAGRPMTCVIRPANGDTCHP